MMNSAPSPPGLDDCNLLLDHAVGLPRPLHLHQATGGGRQVSWQNTQIRKSLSGEDISTQYKN